VPSRRRVEREGGNRYKLQGPGGPERRWGKKALQITGARQSGRGTTGEAATNYSDPRFRKESQRESRYKLPGPEGPEGEPRGKPVQITGTRGSGRGARGKAGTNYRDPAVQKRGGGKPLQITGTRPSGRKAGCRLLNMLCLSR